MQGRTVSKYDVRYAPTPGVGIRVLVKPHRKGGLVDPGTALRFDAQAGNQDWRPYMRSPDSREVFIWDRHEHPAPAVVEALLAETTAGILPPDVTAYILQQMFGELYRADLNRQDEQDYLRHRLNRLREECNALDHQRGIIQNHLSALQPAEEPHDIPE